MIAASALLLILSLDGRIARVEGLLLCGGLLAYTYWCIRASRRESGEVEAEFAHEVAVPSGAGTTLFVQLCLIVAGLVLLGVGSHWLIRGSVAVATRLGISQQLDLTYRLPGEFEPQHALLLGCRQLAAESPDLFSGIVSAVHGSLDIVVVNRWTLLAVG